MCNQYTTYFLGIIGVKCFEVTGKITRAGILCECNQCASVVASSRIYTTPLGYFRHAIAVAHGESTPKEADQEDTNNALADFLIKTENIKALQHIVIQTHEGVVPLIEYEHFTLRSMSRGSQK